MKNCKRYFSIFLLVFFLALNFGSKNQYIVKADTLTEQQINVEKGVTLLLLAVAMGVKSNIQQGNQVLAEYLQRGLNTAGVAMDRLADGTYKVTQSVIDYVKEKIEGLKANPVIENSDGFSLVGGGSYALDTVYNLPDINSSFYYRFTVTRDTVNPPAVFTYGSSPWTHTGKVTIKWTKYNATHNQLQVFINGTLDYTLYSLNLTIDKIEKITQGYDTGVVTAPTLNNYNTTTQVATAVPTSTITDIPVDSYVRPNVTDDYKYKDYTGGLTTDIGTVTTGATTGDYTGQLTGIAGLLQGIKDLVTSIPQKLDNIINPDVPQDVNIDFTPFQAIDLTKKFPFSIPWDILNSFKQFSGLSSQAPKWTLDFSTLIGGTKVDIDFQQFDKLAMVVRWGILLIFNIGLILKTRDIIKG